MSDAATPHDTRLLIRARRASLFCAAGERSVLLRDDDAKDGTLRCCRDTADIVLSSAARAATLQQRRCEADVTRVTRCRYTRKAHYAL